MYPGSHRIAWLHMAHRNSRLKPLLRFTANRTQQRRSGFSRELVTILINNIPRKGNPVSYHGRSLRKCRYSESGRPYLITTVTHNRKPIFSSFDISRLLIHELRKSSKELNIESLAWVVMPDHLHWLFVLNQSTVSEVTKRIKGASAHSINRYRNCSVPVWQKGFHDHAIRIDEDIKTVARYIIANPLRAGLVENIGDYPLWDAIWL